MKITSKQYALSLYKLVQNRDEKEINFVLKNFVNVLAKNSDLKLSKKIITEFEKFCDEADGTAKIDVISVKKLDKEIIGLLNKHIAAKLDKKNIIINNKISKNILGGIILKYGDTIIDGSFRKKINCLKNKLNK
ncbi:MAG: ATP synthase F1 subunit delta [Patescibacteria group bacterium]|nr:ATP synthase F1 subunit delta [Patescibacteria group bacterium]